MAGFEDHFEDHTNLDGSNMGNAHEKQIGQPASRNKKSHFERIW
jgi:hypothetical protein